jgi:hypothetical protein
LALVRSGVCVNTKFVFVEDAPVISSWNLAREYRSRTLVGLWGNENREPARAEDSRFERNRKGRQFGEDVDAARDVSARSFFGAARMASA